MLVCVDCGQTMKDENSDVGFFVCFDCLVDQGEY